jgi:hypothetical protein
MPHPVLVPPRHHGRAGCPAWKTNLSMHSVRDIPKEHDPRAREEIAPLRGMLKSPLLHLKRCNAIARPRDEAPIWSEKEKPESYSSLSRAATQSHNMGAMVGWGAVTACRPHPPPKGMDPYPYPCHAQSIALKPHLLRPDLDMLCVTGMSQLSTLCPPMGSPFPPGGGYIDLDSARR